MGRKKSRVATEEEEKPQTGHGLIETSIHSDSAPSVALFPASYPLFNPPTARVAPNDPRRKIIASATSNSSNHQSLLIKEEAVEYCQPATSPFTGNHDRSIQMPPPPRPPSVFSPSTALLNVNQPTFPMSNLSSLGPSILPSAAITNNPSNPVAKPFINTGELIEEDIYISDGSDWENDPNNLHGGEEADDSLSCDDMDQSEEDDDEQQQLSNRSRKTKSTIAAANQEPNRKNKIEIILTTSKMGLIRKGSMHQQLLLQAQQQSLQSKQWVRGKNPNPREQHVVTEGEEDDDANADLIDAMDSEHTSGHIKVDEDVDNEETKVANLDPATRAAQLLIEKQTKMFEAKVAARIVESSENSGRDPCLFSKRTAFDIRMDQIDDRPWLRVGGDITDYFNYDLDEDAWVEYAQTQLEVRQELTDASRQKRSPDPTIIPVIPREPSKQQPRVAVATKKDSKTEEDEYLLLYGNHIVGPTLPPNKLDDTSKVLIKNETETISADTTDSSALLESNSKATVSKFVDIGGGAWGAGAIPGSILAKLIEDQDKVSSGKPPPTSHMLPPPPVPNLPPPPPVPPQSKVNIQMNPRRGPPPVQRESMDFEGDSFMYAPPPEDRNPLHRDLSMNRPRNGPSRLGEHNEFPGPMQNDYPGPISYERHGEWRGDGYPGPPNPRLPPFGEYRGPMQNDMGPPGGMPYERERRGDFNQGHPSNPRFPPQHRGPFPNDSGHPGSSPYQRHGEWRGDFPGPPPPYQDGFDSDSNRRRPREEFNPVAPFGGRHPPQGFGGNNLRR